MILNAVWFILRSGCRPTAPGPTEVAAAVEESLRLEPAAAEVDRYATVDAAIGGTAIPAGAFVAVSLAGANRDPVEFPHPDRFDPSRPNLRRQLAFATGPHVCLGMDLARLETCLAVGALLDALPDLRLDEASPPPAGLVFRKPERLDVCWSAQA
jgi:cytochrome P450